MASEYRLPPRFWWDHHYRDLPEKGVSRLVRETKSYVIVEMDDDALADLRSDAGCYTDAATAREMGMPGLAASARATLRAIAEQAP
jgi:hypothetical protein